MNLAHTFAVAALAIGSTTLLGCGNGTPSTKEHGTKKPASKFFVSFSFESKGRELIVDGKPQELVGWIRAPIGFGGHTNNIKFMFDVNELKFMSSQVRTAVEGSGGSSRATYASEEGYTMIIDIKAKQANFHDYTKSVRYSSSRWFTVPLGDIKPSTFAECLATEEGNMKIDDKKVKVSSMMVSMPSPDRPCEWKGRDLVCPQVQKEWSLSWQVDGKKVPKMLIMDMALPVKANPVEPEDKEKKWVQAITKVSDKESRAGAPPSEVFQVPESWESVKEKATLQKDDEQVKDWQKFMPDAIWKCAGLPKHEVPDGPGAFLATTIA